MLGSIDLKTNFSVKRENIRKKCRKEGEYYLYQSKNIFQINSAFKMLLNIQFIYLIWNV